MVLERRLAREKARLEHFKSREQVLLQIAMNKARDGDFEASYAAHNRAEGYRRKQMSAALRVAEVL